jgi:hypothetical protein
MKRYLWLASVLLLFAAIPSFGQSTTVSGTITDSGGQSWNRGTYNFAFRPSPSNPSGQYFWNGVPFNPNTNVQGDLDGTASFSVNVPSNTAITPSGSTWDVQVCSIAQGNSPCFTVRSVTITGATQNISSAVIPPPIRIDLAHPAYPFVVAYTSSEIVTAPIGGLFYNFTTTHYNMCQAIAPTGNDQAFGTCSTWVQVCQVGDVCGTGSTGATFYLNNSLVAVQPGLNLISTPPLSITAFNDTVNSRVNYTLAVPVCSPAGGSHAAGLVPDTGAVVDLTKFLRSDCTFATPAGGGGSGSPVNSPSPFVFNTDMQFGGPNPYYDVRKAGGYVGDNFNTSVTGTMGAPSSTITISSALDFANGQGVVILGAGPAPSISTPTGVAVAQLGVIGSTPYNYCVVDEDYANGRTVCSTQGTTATGVATLGIQTATITNRVRSAGVVTITTSAAHNFISGSQVNIIGTGDASFEGAFTMTSASGTTLTYSQYGAVDFPSTATSGSAQVAAKNFVTWNAPTGYTTLRHYIYRCLTTCGSVGVNYTLAGVAQGQDSSFVDYGFSITASSIGDGDVPATAPTSVNNQWLPTTIVSGGGTTVLTIAATSTNAVAGVKVFHDNAPILTALCNAFVTGQGGTIYIPAAIGGTNSKFPINSTLNLGQGCGGQAYAIYAASPIWASGSILPGGPMFGMPSGNKATFPAGYIDNYTTVISGTAFPIIDFIPNHSGNDTMKNLVVTCLQPYQACVLQDNDTIGGGVTILNFEDVSLSGATANTPYIAKGGFGYFWKGGSISVTATSFNSPPAVLFTNNCGIGQTGQEGPAIVFTDKTSIFGGMVWDSCGKTLTGPGGFNHMEFKEVLMENAYIPVMRVNITGGATVYAVDFIKTTYADLLGGQSTPMFDVTNMGTSVVAGLTLDEPFCATGFQPAFETSASLAAYNGLVVKNQGGCNIIGSQDYIDRDGKLGIDFYANSELGFQGSGRMFYQIPGLPSPPVSAVVSAGGAVPPATHVYTVAAIDVDGHATIPSSGVSAVVTGGNQTVTVTGPAALPAGAIGWNLYRDNSSVNGVGCATPQFTTPSFVFVDTSGTTCASGPPTIGDAGSSSASSNGLGSVNIYQPNVSTLATPRANVLNEGNLNNWPAFNVNSGGTHNYPGITGAVTVGHSLCSTGTLFEYQDCLSGGINPSVNLALANYCTGGTQICGIALPVSPNGRLYIPTTTPSGGVAQAITFIQPGISTRSVVAGGTDTILTSDLPFQVYYSTGGAIAVTIPALSTAGFANFAMQTNTNLATAGTAPTFTLTGGTINGGATFGQAINSICKWSTHDGINLDASCPSAPSVTGSGTTGSFAKFTSSTGIGNGDIAGDCVTAGTTTCTIPTLTVTAAKSAVVMTLRQCDMGIGDTSSISAISNAQLGPQIKVCKIPYAATIVEIDVDADGGTPSVIVAKRHCTASPCVVGANETVSNLVSSALATAASGGTACSKTGATAGFDTFTTCSATLQNTSIAVGDHIELVSGTAGGTAKWMTIHVFYTVN